MRAVIFTLFTTCTILACRKEQSDADKIIIEPPATKVTTDTITSGTWRGFTIGQTPTEVYAQIQNFPSEVSDPYLGITKNIYTQVSQLENTIPLYTQLLLDEATGTSSGIQISFKDDKVNSIFTNGGTKLTRWPGVVSGDASIAVNDAVSDIYKKLANISTGPFRSKLERISLFSKNVAKSYDPVMANSPRWEFSTITNGGKHYVVALNFSAGVLVTMYVSLLEPA